MGTSLAIKAAREANKKANEAVKLEKSKITVIREIEHEGQNFRIVEKAGLYRAEQHNLKGEWAKASTWSVDLWKAEDIYNALIVNETPLRKARRKATQIGWENQAKKQK